MRVDQARLNVHVHVLERRAPLEAPGVDLGLDFLEPLDDQLALRRRQHTDMRQHACVRDRTGDVVPVQVPVEMPPRP